MPLKNANASLCKTQPRMEAAHLSRTAFRRSCDKMQTWVVKITRFVETAMFSLKYFDTIFIVLLSKAAQTLYGLSQILALTNFRMGWVLARWFCCCLTCSLREGKFDSDTICWILACQIITTSLAVYYVCSLRQGLSNFLGLGTPYRTENFPRTPS